MRGHVEGRELDSFQMEIEGGFAPAEIHSDYPVVTVDPTIPMNIRATSLGQASSGPSQTFAQLVGENIPSLLEVLDEIGCAFGIAPDVLRALDYYIDGREVDYWRFVKREFSDIIPKDWPQHELAFHGTSHHLWQIILTMLAGGPWLDPDVDDAVKSAIKDHSDHLKDRDYIDLLKTAAREGKLLDADRSLLDATRVYVKSSPAWRSGYVRLSMPESTVPDLSQLILLQDEFSLLRDTYQQVFEGVCRAMWVALPVANLRRNGSPQDCLGLHYQESSGKLKPVASIAAFRKLSNAYKLDVLRRSTPYGALFSPLDNHLRNSIGHASARHDLGRGEIVNDKGERLHYFDFVGKVYSLALPLMGMVVLLRGARVLSSMPDADAGPGNADPR